MNHYITRYRESMLLLTSQAGTLAEEVISSIRNTHAFGTQKKLAAMYDKPNLEAMQLGIKSSVANGIGMGGFFFVIYAAYALAFYYGTTLILQGRATSGEVVNVFCQSPSFSFFHNPSTIISSKSCRYFLVVGWIPLRRRTDTFDPQSRFLLERSRLLKSHRTFKLPPSLSAQRTRYSTRSIEFPPSTPLRRPVFSRRISTERSRSKMLTSSTPRDLPFKFSTTSRRRLRKGRTLL